MQKLHYTIYKITNLVNNKIYIGKHQTTDLNDGYLGSGKLLRKAIDKYGVENFSKEILHVFDNEEDMNAKERELVTEEFVLQESNYNLCVGGRGGWSYLNNSNKSKNTFENAAIQTKASSLGNQTKENLYITNPDWKKLYISKIRKSHSDGLIKYDNFKGKSHSDKSKLKMSQSSKGKGSGKDNSQYGTRWITNGFENRKIKKTDSIPDGWYAGRKL